MLGKKPGAYRLGQISRNCFELKAGCQSKATIKKKKVKVCVCTCAWVEMCAHMDKLCIHIVILAAPSHTKHMELRPPAGGARVLESPPHPSSHNGSHTTPLTALGQDPKGPAGTGKKRSFTKQSTCLGLPAGLPALTAADSLEVFFSPSSGMPWTLSSAQNTL